MNYSVIIITQADLPDDPAFVYPFEANKLEDLEVWVREAIVEWRQFNSHRSFLEVGCTVLVEKTVVRSSPQAMFECRNEGKQLLRLAE